MPRGDGTGPAGGGGGGGRRGQGGQGGRGGGGNWGGPGGSCVCPQCGAQAEHQQGVPCSQMRCPKCNCVMTRAR